MDISIVVAKMLSLVFLATGLAAISGQTTFKEMMKDFANSKGLSFITGFIAIICGVLLVELHNVWVKDWPVLITIVGWASLIKGFVFIAYPDSLKMFKGWYKNTQQFGLLVLAIGILFGYFGFMA